MSDDLRDKLANLTTALMAVVDGLKDLTNEEPAAEENKASPAEEKASPGEEKTTEPQPTLEEVRTVLAEISRKGKTAEMKALLSEFGAAKLSDVDPTRYKDLLAAAREVTDA